MMCAASVPEHFNFYRDYDPNTGRYLEADPIGIEAGGNLYAYADGNPATQGDPLGLFSLGDPASWPTIPAPIAQAIIGFGDSFGIPEWLRDDELDQFVDKCSPAYIWGRRIGFVWGLVPFAERGLAELGGTRLGRFLNLNSNRFARFGPGRMPRNGPFPSGTHVPRASFRGPWFNGPHQDLRTRIPYVPPFGGPSSSDDCGCQ